MQQGANMEFTKIKIICHGARALRIGERIIRRIWKNLNSQEIIDRKISKEERLKIFHSIDIEPVILYPCDIEKIDTGCQIIVQIILNYDDFNKIEAVCKKCNDVPNITYAIDSEKIDFEIQEKAKEILDLII